MNTVCEAGLKRDPAHDIQTAARGESASSQALTRWQRNRQISAQNTAKHLCFCWLSFGPPRRMPEDRRRTFVSHFDHQRFAVLASMAVMHLDINAVYAEAQVSG